MELADSAQLPPVLARFLMLWHAKRGQRRMPARADFSHDELRPWMGLLHVMAVEGDEARFVVFAETSAKYYGREMTGKLLSQYEPKALADAALADHRRFMAGGGVPMSKLVTGPFEDRVLRWTRLAVPLSDDGETVRRYFVALQFDPV